MASKTITPSLLHKRAAESARSSTRRRVSGGTRSTRSDSIVCMLVVTEVGSMRMLKII